MIRAIMMESERKRTMHLTVESLKNGTESHFSLTETNGGSKPKYLSYPREARPDEIASAALGGALHGGEFSLLEGYAAAMAVSEETNKEVEERLKSALTVVLKKNEGALSLKEEEAFREALRCADDMTRDRSGAVRNWKKCKKTVETARSVESALSASGISRICDEEGLGTTAERAAGSLPPRARRLLAEDTVRSLSGMRPLEGDSLLRGGDPAKIQYGRAFFQGAKAGERCAADVSFGKPLPSLEELAEELRAEPQAGARDGFRIGLIKTLAEMADHEAARAERSLQFGCREAGRSEAALKMVMRDDEADGRKILLSIAEALGGGEFSHSGERERIRLPDRTEKKETRQEWHEGNDDLAGLRISQENDFRRLQERRKKRRSNRGRER